MQYILIITGHPGHQRLKEEYHNLVLSTLTKMISDRSSQLNTTKEDSKKVTICFPSDQLKNRLVDSRKKRKKKLPFVGKIFAIP